MRTILHKQAGRAGWVLLLALGLSAVGGCSESLEVVQPWDRGELAGDLMRPDLNTLEQTDWDHIYFSKEGSAGGFSTGGGGCGCN
ncbi:MAG: DUF4266 domain-containing protein [Deltaproteobacteria bacterium]|nr:DUF4266 domain-containing protein [Deltaproteobacteria bacterium]